MMRFGIFAGSLTLAGAALVPAIAQAETPPVFGEAIERSHYISSFDGTRIAVSIHVPTRAGRPVSERLPVVVTQFRSDGMAETMQPFLRAGYVWVAQDRRGTGASFGVQTGFVNQADARDAKAVIEWAAAQSFSTGKVVATGCSNQGAWQYLAATLKPKGLVAIAPACASPQFFDHGVKLNGIPMLPLADKPYAGECARPQGGARPVGAVLPPPQRVDEDTDGTLLRAAVKGQQCGAQMLGQYWRDMPRDGVDPTTGRRPGLEDSAITAWQAIKASGIGVLQLGGWYDAAVAGQLEGQRLWGGRLVMGPWVHVNRPGEGSTFPEAGIDLDDETLRWFDAYAKGIGQPRKPSIRYYTMNAPAGREWREAATWPSYRKVRYHFAPDGTLSRAAPARDAAPAVYAGRDVPWFGGKYMPLMRFWAGDMAATDAQSLTHTLAPLDRDTEVTGTPTAELWVSADTPDANVFAVLEDVAPDGRSTYVTDGRLRASWRAVAKPAWAQGQTWHRGHAEDIKPLVPGEPTSLAFDFFPTSWVFKAGHRIRVSIVTSLGARYQDPTLAMGRTPHLTLYRDAAHRSSVNLPIAPTRR